jgi:hypothetical protein
MVAHGQRDAGHRARAVPVQSDGLGDTTWGDGVRCLGDSLIRPAHEDAVGGVAQYPEPGDQSLSVRGQIVPGSGETRYYQGYYRKRVRDLLPTRHRPTPRAVGC